MSLANIILKDPKLQLSLVEGRPKFPEKQVSSPKSDVVAALETYQRVQRMYPLTESDYLRVSHIVQSDFCAREMVLASRFKVVMERRVPLEEALMLDLGTSLHTLLQQYLGTLGILIGDWGCEECRVVQENVPLPQQCPLCKSKRFKFIETAVFNRMAGLSAHYDGKLFGDVFRLLEIKSTGLRWFLKLTAPKTSAVHQAQLYMFLTGIKNHVRLQ